MIMVYISWKKTKGHYSLNYALLFFAKTAICLYLGKELCYSYGSLTIESFIDYVTQCIIRKRGNCET